MATDLAKLVVKLEAQTAQYDKKLAAANKKTKKFEKNTKKSLGNISNSFKTLLGGAALGLFVRAVIKSTATMEGLEARLISVTGSAESAASSLNLIKKFAATTPFQLEEVTDSFIKLVALGLNPSEAALRSYGNTASAMGKSLNQLIEAVADASVGEFERLKEFGIKAKSEGANVSFTFQGVTTTVKKSSNEIQGYLQKIGDVNFAGAMERQANTVAGILSTVKDSFTQLLVAEGGLEDAKDALREFNDLLNDPAVIEGVGKLTTAIIVASGKLVEFATISTGLIAGLSEDIASFVGGPLIGDMNGLTKQLANLEIVAARTRAQIFRKDPNANLFSSDYTYTDTLAKIELVKEKILETQRLLDKGINSKKPDAGVVVGGGGGASSTDTEDSEAAKDAIKAQEAQLQSFLSTMQSLRTPMEVFSDQQAIAKSLLAAGKIEQQDYNNALTHYNQLLNDATGANDQWKQDLTDSAAFAEQAKTEVEKLNEELARATELEGKGLLSTEALSRTAARIEETKENLKDATDELDTFAEQAARNIQDQLGDTILNTMDGTTDGVLDAWGDMLKQMISQAAAAQLSKALGLEDFLSGEGGGDGLFAKGASFLGGFFADGGRPPPGKVSVVGEEGPELFIPDGVSGSIIPNGGGGGSTVQIASMVFPGVRTEKEAKIASGAAARQISQLVNGGGRYS
ncbi:MAG: tape measure protein [Porticoccus sp.]|nr:tape measure protein [Porticoccus sp.]